MHHRIGAGRVIHNLVHPVRAAARAVRHSLEPHSESLQNGQVYSHHSHRAAVRSALAAGVVHGVESIPFQSIPNSRNKLGPKLATGKHWQLDLS
jgi:hypothetical protein